MTDEASAPAMRRAALTAAIMASFLTPFLLSGVNVALPAIGADLHMHAVALSWVTTSFILASAVLLVPFGRLADSLGRKKVFMVGMTVFTVASLGCGLATHANILLAFRVLQGAGSAMIYGTALAILTAVFPQRERGRVLGLNAAAVYTGLSAGPFIGGFCTEYLGWQSVFLACVPVGLGTLLVAAKGLKGEWRGETGGRFDLIGALVYGFTLVTLMTGLSAEDNRTVVTLLAVAAGALGLFLWWERRVEHPVIEMNLLSRNRVFARSNLATLIFYTATFAVTFLLSLHLQFIHGLDPAQAGLVLLTQSVIMAALSPVAGLLSDRLEPRVVASAGAGLSVVALVWLGFLHEQTSLVAIIGALVLLGAGFGLYSSPNTNAIMSSVERKDYGVASATLGTMRLVGQMLSMGLAAAVLAHYIGRAAIKPAVYGHFLHGVRTAFLICAGLCTIGLVVSLARGNVRAAAAAAKD